MLNLLQQIRQAGKRLATLTTEQKDAALFAMAQALREHQAAILKANQRDVEHAEQKQISDAMRDRLLLNPARIEAMACAIEAIIALPDPVNTERFFATRPNGLHIYKRRIPLGVIAMIYEARPNVTAEAGALCLKSGNACLLRGGSEAFFSNQCIATIVQTALSTTDVEPAVISVMPNTDRADLLQLLQQDQLIDLVIPRGGEGLIRFVAENSRIPVIKHYKGVCHLYVDAEADPEMALRLLVDGKCTRPAVCNALETVLVHSAIADYLMPRMLHILSENQVEILGCERTCRYDDAIALASDEDFACEFLSLKITVKIVEDMEQAIAHIARFGSQHTEVIVTQNTVLAERFVREVDASSVMVNASSRFNDGGELGLGSEIGIATTKLHAYGPMGLESLTAEKFVVRGDGQIRHP